MRGVHGTLQSQIVDILLGPLAVLLYANAFTVQIGGSLAT